MIPLCVSAVSPLDFESISICQCIKFKTYSSMFLNRFDALNQSLMEKMQNQTSRPALVEASREEPVASAAATAPVIPAPVPTAAAGGVKKKKKKSKKVCRIASSIVDISHPALLAIERTASLYSHRCVPFEHSPSWYLPTSRWHLMTIPVKTLRFPSYLQSTNQTPPTYFHSPHFLFPYNAQMKE